MLKVNKRILRLFSVALLVLGLVISQFNTSANEQASPKSNDDLIKAIINTDDTKISLENTKDSKEAKVTMDFHIDTDVWESIQTHANALEFEFPNSLQLSDSQPLKFLNTDKNIEKNVYHSLDDSIIKVTEKGFSIDFTQVDSIPSDFRLEYHLNVLGTSEDLKALKASAFPTLEAFRKNLIEALEGIEMSTVPNDESSGEENIIDENNGEQDAPDVVDQDEKTIVSGEINLELNGNPKAHIKHSNKLIDESNPIDMATYSETATNYTIDLFTDADEKNLGVNYRVSLDDASLALINEENINQSIQFQKMEDGKQVPYHYEYTFPELIRFYPQTGESIPASLKLAEYSTSSFERVNKDQDDGVFKLIIDEVKLESNVEDIPDQYKFQNYISEKINAYIQEEFAAGVSLETIKTALREGITIETDAYNLSDYHYTQLPKAEFEHLMDYPLTIPNLMDSNKDIVESLPVNPTGGIHNRVNSVSFEQIPNGFELKWDGLANTNRKSVMNTLDLTFDAPAIVKTTGYGDWHIKTTVNVSYFDILNDGTHVSSASHTNETLEFINAATDKIEPISVPLVDANVAVVYDVKQAFTNDNLNLEIEGKQVGRLTSRINETLFSAVAENTKEFPRSITINGIRGAEGTPTSLLWNIVYNNNKLIRGENNGFDFILDTSKVKVSSYNGKGESYTDLPLTFEQLKVKPTLLIDGKTVEKDGRFDVTWNETFTQAQVRIKSGQSIDEEVKIQVRYEIDVMAPYTENGTAIRDSLKTSSKLKFEGSAQVKSYTNGQLIEPTTPTEEELKAQQAVNYLVLLDKRPIMIDYRTKEVIWGVAINTVTAQRIGLPGLTFTDDFGEGLEFSELNETHPMMMFKVDASKLPQTSYTQYSRFISAVKEIMDDREIYANEIPNEIIALMGEKIDPDDEESKLFGDVIQRLSASEIAYIFDENASYNGQDIVVSRPSNYPGYTSKLPSTIQNGDGDPYVSQPTKNEYLKDKDIRIDFVSSNNAIGGATDGGDNNAYYVLYKTKIVSDKPLENVSNSGSLLFADWIIGTGNTIDWTGGDIETAKDLGEVAKYNTIPKKEGVVKVIQDPTSNRARLAVEWTVTFNYDVDMRRVDNVPFVVIDTVDKTRDRGTFNLGNEHLSAQDITEIELLMYTVGKDGELTLTDETQTVTTASGELVIREDDDVIEYAIRKDLDPSYVYRYKINTLIESQEAIIGETEDDIASLVVNGNFENKVSYTRGSQAGQTELPDPGIAIAQAELTQRNRVSKTGRLVSGSYVGSRQEILWTLTLNETYENMNDVVITDTLESKHRFKFIKNATDLEQSNDGKAELDRFSIQEFKNGRWTTIPSTKYVLSNLEGHTDKPLDNWITGESGFIMTFNEAMSNPIRIQYASFGHVVDNAESPLINHVDLQYKTDANLEINHQVKANVNVKVNDGPGGYESDRYDIGLTMRYNDNQAASPTDLDKGHAITGNRVDETILILYRYQKDFAQNNHIYRIGKPDANGYLELKNLEKGHYIIKQFNVADGYSVPNSLGYVMNDRNPSKDKSVVIDNNQLLSGNLVTIHVDQTGRSLFDFFKDEPQEKFEYAVYNTTPVFEVNTYGKLLSETGTDASVSLPNVNLNVSDGTGYDEEFTSSNTGTFKVGTVAVGDPRIDFGDYAITQEKQDLEGYLINSEVVSHTIAKNPNGTIDATRLKANFENHKVSATLRVFERDTTTLIPNSSYTLERNIDNQWVAYDQAASTGKKDGNRYEVTQGTLDFHNLDVGHYRLTQVGVEGGYLLNPTPLEFYAYGPEREAFTDTFEGKPDKMVLTFDNIKAKLNVMNVIGTDPIDGSEFEIKDSQGQVVETFTITNKDEGYTTHLKPGDYTLHETNTIANRPVNLSPLSFNIESVEGVFEDELSASQRNLVFENHLGSFTFVTHTPNGEDFSVDAYTMTYRDEVMAPVSQTDLHAGFYTLEDLSIDSNWIYVAMDHEFTVPESYTDPAILDQDVHVYGTQAVLNYKNRDGDKLSDTSLLTGATFKLTSNDLEFESDLDKTRFSNLKPGSYALSQTQAPTGYGLNTATIPSIGVPVSIQESVVIIDKDTHNVGMYTLDDVIYYNYRGKVELKKISAETQSPLEGVVFNLYREGVLLDVYTTDSQGLIALESLEPGNYYFEEIEGDGNHTVTLSKTPFTIASQNENAYPVHKLEVSNYYADIVFKNTNLGKDIVYTDGLFTLYENDNGNWVPVDGFIDFTATPNTDHFTIFGVKPNDYKLVQTRAPFGTVRNTYEYEFNVPTRVETEADGRVTIVLDDYINYQARVEVALVDQDGDFTSPVSAIFSDGNSEGHSMTQEGSTLIQNSLGSGDYAITVNRAEGAIVYDEYLQVHVPESALNDEGLTLQLTARMMYARGDFTLHDGRTLKALTSGIFEVNGQPYTIDDSGSFEISHLGPGRYDYIQTQAANAYILNTLNQGSIEVFETRHQFDDAQINQEGYPFVDLGTLPFLNYQANLHINKIDEQGNPLKDVIFGVIQGDAVSMEAITDIHGFASIEGIAPGRYVLKELQGLPDYEPLKETIAFDVVSEYPGKPVDLYYDVTNTKITKLPDPTLPSTGIGPSIPWTPMTISGIGLVMMVVSKRRKEKKQ